LTIAWASTVAVAVPSPAWSEVLLVELVALDLLGDGDPVLADAGDSVRFVENDVAALGAERHLQH
jgi:hypothetical protein